jgi:8-oxo-dGTP pyrophosphatase MutT (NUDIX family)
MAREISSGGVVLRAIAGEWHIALIEPQREELKTSKASQKKAVLALPKGLVDKGETPQETAVREVREETGVSAELITKLTDIKYVYVRSWGDGERVFKIVSFYLLKYVSGEIGEIAPEMRIEVKQALWVPLAEAPQKLAYSNERRVLQLAAEYLEKNGLTGRQSSAS